MLRTLVLALLACLLVACNQNTPLDPADLDSGIPGPSLETEPGGFDPLNEIFREGAGLLQGDITLNGTTETDPNWDVSPMTITQQVQQGMIAVMRVRGRLSDSAQTTLFAKVSQPGKAYPAYYIPGTNVDQHKAIYLEQPDSASLAFYNSSFVNTPVNSKSALFNYSFKTMALENADEPNDDDNGATITDRTLAKNIPLNFVATRSVFQVDNSPLKDVEEWYKVTLPANTRIAWKFATTPSQHSSWSFTMKLYTNGGNQVGSTVNVASTAANANLEHTIAGAGTYFLQIVGTPISKSYTNMFYKLYTITPCLVPVVSSLDFDPQVSCPGTSRVWSANATQSPTSYSWNFGGGCTPNTSSAATPSVTLGAAGTYTASLTVSNGCSTSRTFQQQYTVACPGGVGIVAAPESGVFLRDIEVLPDGTTFVTGDCTGSPDLDPGPGVSILENDTQPFFLLKLDPLGNLIEHRVFPALPGGAAFPVELAVDPAVGVWIAGNFVETVDFDPGPGVQERTAVTPLTFAVLLDPALNFRNVLTFKSEVAPRDLEIVPVTGDAMIVGRFSGTVDFDPGIGTFNKVGNNNDGYAMIYDQTGHLVNGVTFGSSGFDECASVTFGDNRVFLAGMFNNTVDFDPGAGTANLTGTDAGYVVQLQTADLSFIGAMALGGTGSFAGIEVEAGVGGVVYVAGNWSGTIDFDPGAGVQNRISNGSLDFFVGQYSGTLSLNWLTNLGGVGSDFLVDLAYEPGGNQLRIYGNWINSVDFDPGPGLDVRTAPGGQDGQFILGFSSLGARQFASTWTGPVLGPEAVSIDSQGIARACGVKFGPAEFDPGPETFTVPAIGFNDGFIQRVNANGLWD